MNNAELLYQTLKEKNFSVKKWTSEGLDFTDFIKVFNNGVKVEFTICSRNGEYHSHTFELGVENRFAEIALLDISEFISLINILDK